MTGPAGWPPRSRTSAWGVWFDDERIEPFASIPDRVRAGLGEAKVLVAWYSAAYPTRRACREELTLALLAAERAGEGPERVLVVNPEPGMGHVLEARLLDRLYRFKTNRMASDLVFKRSATPRGSTR
jgi:hypothetical protein